MSKDDTAILSPEYGATDGRRARGEKTRALIVDALMALIEEGNLQPSSEEVAVRAAVGHRTVFRHFQEMDRLYREIDDRLEVRLMEEADLVDPSLPLEARVAAMVAKRSKVFEQMTMFRRATTVRLWISPYLQSARQRYVGMLRERLYFTLPELKKKPSAIQIAVEAMMSFEAWDQMRFDQKRSVAKSREAMHDGVLGLLA